MWTLHSVKTIYLPESVAAAYVRNEETRRKRTATDAVFRMVVVADFIADLFSVGRLLWSAKV